MAPETTQDRAKTVRPNPIANRTLTTRDRIARIHAFLSFAVERTPMGQLEEETVIVTGASRGLGASMAKRFAREGANTVLTARSRDELVNR